MPLSLSPRVVGSSSLTLPSPGHLAFSVTLLCRSHSVHLLVTASLPSLLDQPLVAAALPPWLPSSHPHPCALARRRRPRWRLHPAGQPLRQRLGGVRHPSPQRGWRRPPPTAASGVAAAAAPRRPTRPPAPHQPMVSAARPPPPTRPRPPLMAPPPPPPRTRPSPPRTHPARCARTGRCGAAPAGGRYTSRAAGGRRPGPPPRRRRRCASLAAPRGGGGSRRRLRTSAR